MELRHRFLKAFEHIKRNENILTNKQFCTVLDINETVFSSFLKGKRPLPMDDIYRFVNKYGISLDWLLTGNGEMLRSSQNVALAQLSTSPATCSLCQVKDVVVSTLQDNIATLKASLKDKDTIIAGRDKEIHRLESELATLKKEASILGSRKTRIGTTRLD